MNKAKQILEKIYGRQIDWTLRAAANAVPQPGWTNPTPLFHAIAKNKRVESYLEVGSWLGASAIRAGEAFPDASITCVDTWTGSPEHWIDRANATHNLQIDAAGIPQVFAGFARNIINAGMADRVAPIQLPSATAAKILAHHNLTWDVIYIDGSHETDNVMQDCRSFWPLARCVMMGDDWPDPRFGVADGVVRWMQAEGIPMHRLQLHGGFWVIEKLNQ